MKKDTYYSAHRTERLEYQRNNPTICSICLESYTNKKSHFRNPKWVIRHQAALAASLRTQTD